MDLLLSSRLVHPFLSLLLTKAWFGLLDELRCVVSDVINVSLIFFL